MMRNLRGVCWLPRCWSSCGRRRRRRATGVGPPRPTIVLFLGYSSGYSYSGYNDAGTTGYYGGGGGYATAGGGYYSGGYAGGTAGYPGVRVRLRSARLQPGRPRRADSGLGVRPGLGFGAPGMGIGGGGGGLGGPASGMGVRPGLGVGGLGRGR